LKALLDVLRKATKDDPELLQELQPKKGLY